MNWPLLPTPGPMLWSPNHLPVHQKLPLPICLLYWDLKEVPYNHLHSPSNLRKETNNWGSLSLHGVCLSVPPIAVPSCSNPCLHYAHFCVCLYVCMCVCLLSHLLRKFYHFVYHICACTLDASQSQSHGPRIKESALHFSHN